MKIIRCSRADYWDALECLPPSFAALGDKGGIVAFMGGEPWDHVNGIPTFSGYLMIGLSEPGIKYFRTADPVTAGEFAVYLMGKLGFRLQRWAYEG
jgi:hypothetical protein